MKLLYDSLSEPVLNVNEGLKNRHPMDSACPTSYHHAMEQFAVKSLKACHMHVKCEATGILYHSLQFAILSSNSFLLIS